MYQLARATGSGGTGALFSISKRLQKKLPGLRGFSERNLKYMRTFYEEWSPLLEFAYEDSAEASAETAAADAIEIRQKLLPNSVSVPSEHFLNIGFSHHCQILTSVKDVEERLYYVEACAREHMSLERLRRAIRNDNYHHQGTLPNNFTQALPSPQQALRAIETFKNEYLLDFINVEEIGVRDVGDVDERVVEQAIVSNVKNFIMEFGRGLLVHRQRLPSLSFRRGPVHRPAVLQPRPQPPRCCRAQAWQVQDRLPRAAERVPERARRVRAKAARGAVYRNRAL